MDAALGLIILTVTIALALARPRLVGFRVQPWSAALLGGVATVAVGLVSFEVLGQVLAFLTLPVLTIVSLMIITIVADRAGFFRILAWWIARRARLSGPRLFTLIFFIGALVGVLFTNDAAVLIFTPMVYRLIEEVQLPGWTMRQKMPFYFAVLYVANLVGPLIISNPINVVVGRWFGLGFVDFATWMALPAVAAAVVTYLGIRWVFRNDIPATFGEPPRLARGTLNVRFMAASAVVLALTLVGFFLDFAIGVPLPYVAAAGALALLIVDGVFHKRAPVTVVRHVAWDVIAFVIGIFVVANGLRAAGVTAGIGDVITWADGGGEFAGSALTMMLSAVGSAAINNHPVADMVAIAILDLDLPQKAELFKVYASLIGGDMGPKMLPIGSLAALIWFRLLRDRGVDVPYSLYIRIGIPVTLIALAAAFLVLSLQVAFGWG